MRDEPETLEEHLAVLSDRLVRAKERARLDPARMTAVRRIQRTMERCRLRIEAAEAVLERDLEEPARWDEGEIQAAAGDALLGGDGGEVVVHLSRRELEGLVADAPLHEWRLLPFHLQARSEPSGTERRCSDQDARYLVVLRRALDREFSKMAASSRLLPENA